MVLLVSNWKMAPETKQKSLALARATNTLAKKYKKKIDWVVCPPFLTIATVQKLLKSATLGAQTVASRIEVAQTGLIGASMLRDFGVRYVIVGHSEARSRGETNEIVAQQIGQLLEKKIVPIICVGERERDPQGWYLGTLKEQVETAISHIPKAMLKNIVFAYEPVWAIGKDAERVATAAECHAMIIFIRKIIADRFDDKSAGSIPVLYGGSVDELNARTFIVEGTAQGLLMGRVSLDAKRLAKLVESLG